MPGSDGPVYEQHKTKLDAGIALNFAVRMGGAKVEECGLYKRDPRKHEGEQDLLPAEQVKARKRALKKALLPSR